jgi:hypothetical protein
MSFGQDPTFINDLGNNPYNYAIQNSGIKQNPTMVEQTIVAVPLDQGMFFF